MTNQKQTSTGNEQAPMTYETKEETLVLIEKERETEYTVKK